MSPSASLIDQSNEIITSDLAATGCFFDSVAKEAHRLIANAENAVVFNMPNDRSLPLVQSTILNACNVNHRPRLCFGLLRKSHKKTVQFYSRFMNCLLWSL